jgi:hypothetical protein
MLPERNQKPWSLKMGKGSARQRAENEARRHMEYMPVPAAPALHS